MLQMPEFVSSRVRHLGFVNGAQLLDNAFSVSPAEAFAMDPQRLLLGYEALHTSKYDRVALTENPDWNFPWIRWI